MGLQNFLADFGLSSSYALAGTAGGLLRALSRKRFRMREVFVSPVCGALAAAYLTDPVIHYARMLHWPMPNELTDVATNNAAAFLVGVIAMWITDIVTDRLMKLAKPTEPH